MRARKVTDFLQNYFPSPAPWERTDDVDLEATRVG